MLVLMVRHSFALHALKTKRRPDVARVLDEGRICLRPWITTESSEVDQLVVGREIEVLHLRGGTAPEEQYSQMKQSALKRRKLERADSRHCRSTAACVASPPS